jgi:hypothetical protein
MGSRQVLLADDFVLLLGMKDSTMGPTDHEGAPLVHGISTGPADLQIKLPHWYEGFDHRSYGSQGSAAGMWDLDRSYGLPFHFPIVFNCSSGDILVSMVHGQVGGWGYLGQLSIVVRW